MFALPPLRRSTSLALQVLIFGIVRDALTPDHAPRGALEVRLIDRDTATDYGLRSKVQPDGGYAFYGLPDVAFPRLESQVYRLRVTAAAPGYHDNGFDFDLGPLANQPQLVERPLALAGVPPMQVRLFTATLPRRIDLNLNRAALRLHGRVVRTADPLQGIANASLSLNPAVIAAAVSGADGQFSFADPLPVAQTLQIDVTAAGFNQETVTFEPDYSRPVNSLVVRLTEEE
ncbi:MAG: hypothetical protein HC822_22010 [Oscillochloris sp.]|nr:hypothetical protein [Oscillochloris sp.]